MTFDIATADNTATDADNDYEPKSLTGQTIPAGSDDYTFSVVVNGDTVPEPDETFFVNVSNVTGANVGDAQGQGTIVNDDVTIARIHDIQGNGSAVTGAGPFTVEAIVVGDYQTQGSGQLRGFFIQEEDADVDADPATSEGIFVFCATCPVAVSVGDKVRVTGTASEFFNMSQLDATTVSSVSVQSSNNTLPTPATVQLPVPGVPNGDLSAATAVINAYFEAFEGMLVTFPDTLSVSEYFELARYGQVILTEGGRPRTFTDANTPSAAGLINHEIDLAKRTIILDDTDNRQNRPVDTPNTDYFHPVPGLSITNFFRGGDTITDLTGVLHWSFAGQSGTDAWRIRPVTEEFDYEFTSVNPRPEVPVVDGSLLVASFNVLNYFPSIDTVNDCGPNQNQDCRGADSQDELDRQHTKMLAALSKIDADVFGFMEMENTTGVEPLADIVADLPGYDYIDTGVIGTDTIRVGIIYKTAVVEPIGDYEILTEADDPRFNTSRNRPALAQTFEEIATGERFTVVVNHLKSKGSGCGAGDDDTTTGQGNCNGTRTEAAEAMADWLATDPTGSGDPDFLIIGDLNSYAKEDPIVALQDAGYIDLVADFGGPNAYGYVFDGQLGYLDHALANASLYPQVADVEEWHINADEIPLFDYNDAERTADEAAFEEESDTQPLYEPNEFRTSDHDPILIGLNLDSTPPDTTAPTVTINQASGQSDPTSTSPINFTVVFSEPVTGFTSGDVTLGGTAGATTAVVTETGPMDGTTYNVAVSGMTNSGTVTATVPANVAEDAAGNDNTASTSTDNSVTYNAPDTTAPTVTINQAGTQSDPTSTSPINFTVVFSEPVTGFTDGDVTLGGTAGATTATVSGGPTTYNVAVGGMTNDGTVIATIAADVAEDGAGNGNEASTSTDNTVTYVAPVGPAAEIYVSTSTPGNVGPVVFGNEDILRWDGSAWSVWFDGTAAGLMPNGKTKHNINAFSISESGTEILMSFVQNARVVPGIPGKVNGMDLVEWDGSAFSLVFDGQDVGLTVLTQEKIDALHELDPSLAPAAVVAAAGGSCERYFLISTAGNGKVPNYDGTQMKISGEDVLGFCATQLGDTTAGKWHMVLDGSAKGVNPNAIVNISASPDGQTLYFTTKAAFNVGGASGGHSMVYKYEFGTGQFSGHYFSAPANGLTERVDGLQVVGDLP